MKTELLRIENGMLESSDGVFLRDLYLYAFCGETIGMVYDNFISADSIIRVLSGNATLDSGTLFYYEKRIPHAAALGVFKRNATMISEKTKLSPNLTVLENYHLQMRPASPFLRNPYRYARQVSFLLQAFSVPFDLFDYVHSLSPLLCSIAELLLAYLSQKQYVILLNPNNYFSASECREFMRYVNRLTALGMTFFIFDYDLDFLRDYTNRIFLVQHGQTAGIFDSRRKEDVSRLVYSGDPTKPAPPRGFSPPSREMLRFQNVSSPVFQDVSFRLRQGEILSITCSQDREYQSLRALLFGRESSDSGTIFYRNQYYTAQGLQHSIRQGLCIVEENSIHTMLNENTDVLSNCCMDVLHKISGPILQNKYLNSIRSRLSEYFTPADFSRPVHTLSPFEKQTLVFCKMLLYAPSVLVCMRPFAFPDVKMFGVVRNMIADCARNNISVLILSLQSPNLAGLNATEYMLYRGVLSKPTQDAECLGLPR